MIKQTIIALISIIILCSHNTFAEETPVLSAGISLNAQAPMALMGTWRVVSKLSETDSPENFKNVGVAIWNLSRENDVINLCNPFTGAEASVKVEYIQNNTVRFSKEDKYEDRKLIDTVEITLNGNTFTGKNYLILGTTEKESASPVKTATYILSGRKISGSGILE